MVKGEGRVNVWTFRGFIAVMTLAAVARSAGVASAQVPVTLQAVVDSALSQHPSVAVARQALAAAQAKLAEARAGQNIQVVLSAGSSYGNTVSTGGTTTTGPAATSTSAKVSASLDLINLQARYQIKQAEAAVSSAEASLAQARQGAALAAAQAYFSVHRAQAVVATREAAVAQSEAQVRQAQAQVQAGIAARADVLQAQASLAAAQVDLIAARNQVETALAGLRAAMGLQLTQEVTVAPPAAPPALSLSREQALAGASDRPEVVGARADVAGAQAALVLAQVRAGPLLSVATSSSVDMLNSPNEVVWGVNATITYSLIDGGQAQAVVAEARATLASAQAKEALALQAAQVDAVNALVALQDATARIDATRASETAAAEALRAAEGRYRAGAGTIIEVLTARTAFQSASLSRIQAEFDVQSGVLQLRHAIGRPVIGGD